jgi:predicted RNase H-like HicB family nuclease
VEISVSRGLGQTAASIARFVILPAPEKVDSSKYRRLIRHRGQQYDVPPVAQQPAPLFRLRSNVPAAPCPTVEVMRREFLTVIERIDGTHVAWCPEVPGIFGRGRTKMAALVDLREAVKQALIDRCERGVRDAPQGAVFDSITID